MSPTNDEFSPTKSRINDPESVAIIPIDVINVGDRPSTNRYSPAEWETFKTSLTKEGLIQPIAVMTYGEGGFSIYEYFLLAGWHRIKALEELNQTQVAAKIYPFDLSKEEIFAIRLKENIGRKELNPEQEATEIAEFHKACIDLYGEKFYAGASEGHSLRNTAKLLGLSPAKVSIALNANKLFEAVPGLGSTVSSWSELKRIEKKAERRVTTKRITEEIHQETKARGDDADIKIKKIISGYYKTCHALEGLQSLPSEKIDLVEFDPDYPVDIKTTNQPQHLGLLNDIAQGDYKPIETREEFETFCKAVLGEAYRILKPNGWLILWFGYEYFSTIQDWLKEQKFPATFYHGKWWKGVGHTRNPEHFLNHSIEPFFYVKKTSRSRIHSPHMDVFHYSSIHSSKRKCPYEKPIELYEEILQTFVPRKSWIVSPCAGSGNIGLASANHHCRADLFDLSEAYKEAYVVHAYETVPPLYKDRRGE